MTGPFDMFCFPHPYTCENGSSLAFWVKPNNNKDGVYLSTRAVSDSTGLSISYQNFTVSATIYHTDSQSGIKVKVPDNSWQHIALTISPENLNMTMYINGLKQTNVTRFGSNVSGMRDDAPIMLIGEAYMLYTSTGLNAVLDDLAIWESMLKEDQVRQLYEMYQDTT